jgi:hypothetical protein
MHMEKYNKNALDFWVANWTMHMCLRELQKKPKDYDKENGIFIQTLNSQK